MEQAYRADATKASPTGQSMPELSVIENVQAQIWQTIEERMTGMVSSTVKDLVAGSDLRFRDRGVTGLKGIPSEWRLYALLTDDGPSQCR